MDKLKRDDLVQILWSAGKDKIAIILSISKNEARVSTGEKIYTVKRENIRYFGLLEFSPKRLYMPDVEETYRECVVIRGLHVVFSSSVLVKTFDWPYEITNMRYLTDLALLSINRVY